MDRRDGILLYYSTHAWLKLSAYALAIAVVLHFSLWPAGLGLLFAPLGLDLLGARLIRADIPAFREDVLEELERQCLEACGIARSEPHYAASRISGKIDHWLLRKCPSAASLTLMAPKRDEVVIAERRGRIFPPEHIFQKVAYHTEDAGTRDVFYAAIASVELTDETLILATSGGETITYVGEGEKAREAVELLRARLREFKSRETATKN